MIVEGRAAEKTLVISCSVVNGGGGGGAVVEDDEVLKTEPVCDSGLDDEDELEEDRSSRRKVSPLGMILTPSELAFAMSCLMCSSAESSSETL